MPTNVSGNLTELQRHLSRNNYSRAANLMNELAKREQFVAEVKRVPGLSNFLGNLHTKAITTRSRRLFQPNYRYPNFPGAPARRLRHFIPLYVDALTRNASAHARPNVNMGNAEATERNAARARNAAAAEANRLRRAAAEAHARAQANAVEASRREAAAERAVRNARNAAARAAAERAARAAAERAARNVAAAQAARNAAAAAAAAERAHRARTNAAAANAARQAKAHANAAVAAAAGGAGGSAGTNAAKAAKKAAKNAETAAKAAARLEETRRNEEEKARKKAAHNVAVASWQQRFNAYKSAPHFMTPRQIISKMARNHIQVNIPETGSINRKLLLHIAPNKEFGSNNRKALKTVLMKELTSKRQR